MNSSLPVLYDRWIAEFLPGPVPDEKRATCADCAMCAVESVPRFDPKTKCCTYIPAIPNFLAGQILEAGSLLFQSYWPRADVRPQGVWPDPEFAAQYDPSSNFFGHNAGWRCPYYVEQEGGLCGIWQHRNSRCATWFCKHMRGPYSHDFWSAVDRLLTAIERSLSHWCIRKLNAGSMEFQQTFPVEIGNSSSSTWFHQQSFYEKNLHHKSREFQHWMWGKWIDCEQDFFRECSHLVFSLQWQDVRAIAGPGLSLFAETVHQTYAHLTQTVLPDKVKLSDFHQADVNETEVRVWSINPYDSITLLKSTLRLLHQKNGLPVEEISKVAPRELLLQLVDAGILLT